MKKNAMVVLHEIYGKNAFIKNVCRDLEPAYSVICPNMLNREPFSYSDSEEAYRYFQTEVGFGVSQNICVLGEQLKKQYDKVFLLGFSVGATIAWKCSEQPIFDGIIGAYGSRIRDFTGIQPLSPTLLLFADKDSFNVDTLIHKLQNKPGLTSMKFDAKHGFMDNDSGSYDKLQAVQARKVICEFLHSLDCEADSADSGSCCEKE